jgi:hypothetical protein
MLRVVATTVSRAAHPDGRLSQNWRDRTRKMAIYSFSRRGRAKGAHLSNWHKATGNLSSITRLTEELNRRAWLLARRIDKSDYNISSQQVPERLIAIEIILKGLQAEMNDIFTKEQGRLGSEEEAETDFDNDEMQRARLLLSKLDQQEKRINGKRSRVTMREGKIFFVFNRRQPWIARSDSKWTDLRLRVPSIWFPKNKSKTSFAVPESKHYGLLVDVGNHQ